ncbi:MAG: hypothetical protein OEY14_10925 [Myxococcales bacterium]|nr:hypothetical protein [Myxococcales bacterium]
MRQRQPLRSRLCVASLSGALLLGSGCAQRIEAPPPPRAWTASFEEAPAGARLRIEAGRSGSDEGPNSLVRSTLLLRRAIGELDFAPFYYVERGSDREQLRFDDRSALPGVRYEYVSCALAELERPTLLASSAPTVCSTPSSGAEAAADAWPPGVRSRADAPRDLLVTPIAGAGASIRLEFALSRDDAEGRLHRYQALRAASAAGPFLPFPGGEFETGANVLPGGDLDAIGAEGLHAEAVPVPSEGPWYYRVYAVPRLGEASYEPWLVGTEARAEPLDPRRLPLLLLLACIGAALLLSSLLRRTPIRANAPAAIAAIEPILERASRSGRALLYVPGIEALRSLQTLASLLILGRVARRLDALGGRLDVPTALPLVAEVAAVAAGRIPGPADRDRDPAAWLASDQFAFGVAAMARIERSGPGAALYLGRFYAESLLLAETGCAQGLPQIGGSADPSQLPYFWLTCDEVLIGDDLHAAAVLLDPTPTGLASLRAGDWLKLGLALLILLGALAGFFWPAPLRSLAEALLGA